MPNIGGLLGVKVILPHLRRLPKYTITTPRFLRSKILKNNNNNSPVFEFWILAIYIICLKHNPHLRQGNHC